MKILDLIGNRGTTLSCAAPGAVIGQGIGVRWAQEDARHFGNVEQLLVDRSRAFGVDVVPTDAVMPTYALPKIHVPHPPLERSP